MNKKFLASLATITLALPICTGCSNNSDFDIQFTDNIIAAYVGEKYDFGSTVLKKADGINYTMKAEYYDYTSKTMKDLSVENLSFTPVIQSDVIVTVTGNNSGFIHSKKTSVPVTVRADGIDSLLTNGYSSWADEGISKTINTDSRYIKEGCGNTSISVKYYGSKTWKNQGVTFICPNNFRCLDYWTDKEWNNAILTFWVYNPTEYDFEFQLRVQNNHEGDTVKVDIDWGDPKNTPQYAKPGQWTQIFFSMNKININRPLRITEDESYYDYLILKTYWHGTPTDGSAYSWNMIVDGMDVVDHTVYPDVDTTPFETLDQGWENMATDCGSSSAWSKATVTKISNDACHKAGYDKSTKGLELSFNNGLEPGDLNYAIVFSPEEEERRGGISALPDFGKGSITADIKFSSEITDKTIDFIVTDSNWNTKKVCGINLLDLGDGWMRMKFGLDKVSALKDIGEAIRFGMIFNGVTSANRNTAKVYVDNIFYDPNGNEPAPSYIRGDKFTAGGDVTSTLSKEYKVATDSIKVDVKFVSDDEKHINIMFFDGTDWDNYFGYFELSPKSKTDDYKGVTVEKLDDGYIRFTFKLSELETITGNAPSVVKGMYLRGDWTDASGYIDTCVE